MRGDVLKTLENNYSKKELKKINCSWLAKELGCNRKTISKYINFIINPKMKITKNRKSKLKNYLNVIEEKMGKYNNAISIYEYNEQKNLVGISIKSLCFGKDFFVLLQKKSQ